MDEKNKRITLNTFFLTLRMILLTVITFFTSRVVLDKLGIEDFGIYNVVSSLASTFVFFASSLTNATQRFITIEIGNDDTAAANRIFNLHLLVYGIIGLLVLILSEPIGIWYIENKLNIPPERLSAAQIIYQFSVLTVIVDLLSIVFESLLIAHEDMKVYSYISIFEGIAKLSIVYVLVVIPYDKLIIYGILQFVIFLIVKLSYALYCFRRYKECYLKWFWDINLIRKSFSFISWNFLLGAQVAICDQGVSLILNFFCGPVANAARGITSTVSGTVFKFVNNVLLAVQPPLVKSYARKDFSYLEMLFQNSSRFAYMTLWVFACPLICRADEVLAIWLVDVPMWCEAMVKIALFSSCIYVLSRPAWAIVVASGELKKYALVTGGVSILQFPIAYLFLHIGYSPVCVYVISAVITGLNLFVQLKILRNYFKYNIMSYIKNVILPLFSMTIISFVVSYYISEKLSSSILDTVITCLLSVFVSVIAMWIIVAKQSERQMVLSKIKCMINRKN